MRKLKNEEIEEFASRPGVKTVAVENFLMTMGDDISVAMANLGLDMKLYKWNKDTVLAILDGMWLASGLGEE